MIFCHLINLSGGNKKGCRIVALALLILFVYFDNYVFQVRARSSIIFYRKVRISLFRLILQYFQRVTLEDAGLDLAIFSLEKIGTIKEKATLF
jgi:hypothetical protein